jgi:hypothetical protein
MHFEVKALAHIKELVKVLPQFGQRNALKVMAAATNNAIHPRAKYLSGTEGKSLARAAVTGRKPKNTKAFAQRAILRLRQALA